MDHDGFSFVECLSECVEFYEGAFDASNPRKGGAFNVVPATHDVTNEAAACGLPIVLNGFYEATTVVHKHNGLVAWSDEELIEHVGTLIRDPDARTTMGQRGAEMAKQWDWDRIARQWEDLIIRLATART
jgi:glycosyltransferase involved in cell wall biosynthesis